MNIEEYRAFVAQQEQEANQPPVVEETPPEPTVETVPEVVEQTQEATLPEKVTIEGIGEVTVDELRNGYLRQSDYTKKTQEVSRQRREVQDAVTFYEHLKKNPQLVNQISQTTQVPPALDPTSAKVMELENQLYDMMLEREIETLQNKYEDFEIVEVLQMAKDKNLNNLEDAYHLAKSSKPTQAVVKPENLDALKEQIRKELLAEMKTDDASTQTIISTNAGAPVTSSNGPVLSEQERKVARMMKLSEKDYATWRDAK